MSKYETKYETKYYTQDERVKIVLDIAKKLKCYPGKNGEIVNLYNDEYSFIPEFKKICNEYIKIDSSIPNNFTGKLDFLEIDRKIEYALPIKRGSKCLFVIRHKK